MRLRQALIDSRAKLRQALCSEGHRLNFVETSAGLFHLGIHALSVVFNTHYRDPEDPTSLCSWIKFLGRDTRKMWNDKRALVKQYHACKDLLDNLLTGYMMAWLTRHFHFGTPAEFLHHLPKLSAEALSDAVDNLKTILVDYFVVSTHRSNPAEERDTVHENYILFMQHVMIIRIFLHACRIGDSGVVVDCISVFAIWFQATGKHNYARETIHIKACLSKLWSAPLREFWMDFCLLNPSGKKEGWIACDYFGEYVVREVKAMMHNDKGEVNDRFLRQTISPLILNFRAIREIIETQVSAPFRGQHSTQVQSSADIVAIAQKLIYEGACRSEPGRGGPISTDLFSEGRDLLAGQQPLKKYVEHMQKGLGLGVVISTMDPDSAINIDAPESDAEGSDDEYTDFLLDEGDGWLDMDSDEIV